MNEFILCVIDGLGSLASAITRMSRKIEEGTSQLIVQLNNLYCEGLNRSRCFAGSIM